MLFWYPYKFDLPLSKVPKATYFIATLCVLIFIAQIVNEHHFEKGINKFCTAYTDKSFFDFISTSQESNANKEECRDIIRYFHDSCIFW